MVPASKLGRHLLSNRCARAGEGPASLEAIDMRGRSVRTASTKSASSRTSGSSLTTGSSPPSIDGSGPAPLTSRQLQPFAPRSQSRDIRRLEKANLSHPIAADPAAVRLASQPLAKRIRTFAISTRPVSTVRRPPRSTQPPSSRATKPRRDRESIRIEDDPSM